MAIIKQRAGTPSKAPSLRGAVYIYIRNGQMIAAKWPRKRGPAKTAVHREQTQWFATARKLAKYTFVEGQIAAREATAGTPFLPADLLMSAMAGRMVSVKEIGGPFYRSKRAMADVSDSLDLITDIPGSILVRGDDVWYGLPLPDPGANWIWTRDPSNFGDNQSTSNWCFKGTGFLPRVNAVITDVIGNSAWVQGGQYQALVCGVTAGGTIQTIFRSDVVEAQATEERPRIFPVNATVNTGQQTCILIGRVDDGNNHRMPIRSGEQPRFGMPAINPRFVRIANTSPDIGSVINLLGTGFATQVGMNALY